MTPTTDTYHAHCPTHRDCPPHGPIENEHPSGPGFWHRGEVGATPEWHEVESFAQLGYENAEEAKAVYRRLVEQHRSHGNTAYFTQQEAALFSFATAERWPKS